MAVSAGVLIAYKRRWIRVTQRFFGFVTAAATGFLLLVEDALFSAFGADDGLGFSSGGLAAFGLVTTLVWIYLEVLRVLSILQSDD